jgi:hypothetical protein
MAVLNGHLMASTMAPCCCLRPYRLFSLVHFPKPNPGPISLYVILTHTVLPIAFITTRTVVLRDPDTDSIPTDLIFALARCYQIPRRLFASR